ncbi:P-loop containing nucleoside triphosphate hydrolase protein [Cyathus striatus]|nr:P-loop containing nucleoside triphosphate hydrolase protein [Cyathus striatus]
MSGSSSCSDIEIASTSTTSSFSMRSINDKPQDEKGVGLSNPQLSSDRRRMLDLVNKLHNTGVQVDIDLPQIAVIGSQSAGKSSLIESISGITLPRAAGTCTRCPTECRLARTEGQWKCIISLRRLTDASGQTLGQALIEQFGSIIYDKKDVEERIRRAQRAILNPSKPAKQFLESDDEDSDYEVSFSMNCVSLQITGPDVADLSFCDLPGLIASVSRGGNSSDIKLVESLVTQYIKKPSCIILLTVACETDFENQGAHALAKQYDPEGKRTIGVLTKPDRIPVGEESRWLPFIRNEKDSLDNGWYCVKQPGSNEIKKGITWAEARAQENEFFSMTAPWSELEAIHKKYLRTINLVDRLSAILSDLILKRLPEIQEELAKSIFKTREALSQLPREPSKDPMNDIATLLHEFTTDLTRHIEGIPIKDGLLQSIRPFQLKFKRSIGKTAPQFQPYEKRRARTVPKMKKPIFLLKEDVDDISSSEEAPEHASHNGKASQRRVEKTIYLDEVMDRALVARTRELPGHFPFVVQQTFINEFIDEWDQPALFLCKEVHHVLSEYIKRLVVEHFADFGQGALEQRINVIIQGHIAKCLGRAESQIRWLRAVEDRPFSLNDHYLADYKEKFLTHFKSARDKQVNKTAIDNIKSYSPSTTGVGISSSTQYGISKVLTGLAEMGITGVQAEDLARLLPSDKMEPALVIMADVRAYFQVAYKRFTDNVALAIDYELVRGVNRDILKTLHTGLRINGPDGHRICKELAQESPTVSDRREELGKKLERLNTANEELLHIGF